MNEAVQPVIKGDGASEFFDQAKHVLMRTKDYPKVLEDAQLVGFDTASINAGFIAGLKAASGLLNVNFEFLIEK